MHRLHKTRFYSLVKLYRVNGLSLRTHGNKKRLPNSAFSAATIEPVAKFIMNVIDDKALLPQGRVPGFKRIDVKLLPSSMTKSRLCKSYQSACAAKRTRICWLLKVLWLWSQLCLFIIMMRPASDLCWTSQKNKNQTLKSANLPDAQKAEVVRQQENHLTLAF